MRSTSAGQLVATAPRSTAAWLRNGLRVHDASQRVRASMALDRLPDVAAAFAAGEISEAHVAAIAKVARQTSPMRRSPRRRKLLVDEARKLNTSRFAQAATRNPRRKRSGGRRPAPWPASRGSLAAGGSDV